MKAFARVSACASRAHEGSVSKQLVGFGGSVVMLEGVGGFVTAMASSPRTPSVVSELERCFPKSSPRMKMIKDFSVDDMLIGLLLPSYLRPGELVLEICIVSSRSRATVRS